MKQEKALKFMKLADFTANEFSKDDSTRVGALLLAPTSFHVLASGYNGMPRGCDDTNPARLVRPEKYFWFEHAERNALYNAARAGTMTEGAIAVVTMMPCIDCARGLVQAGISEVITRLPTGEVFERWEDHFRRTVELFKETGIILTIVERTDK